MGDNLAIPRTVRIVIDPPDCGVAIDVCLEMILKNNYHYMTFTNAMGISVVSFDEFACSIKTDINTFPLDYVWPRRNTVGHLSARVMNHQEVVRANNAFQLYQKCVKYPPGHEDHLLEAIRRSQNPRDYIVTVEAR